MPTKSGQPVTSSLHLLGSFVDSRSKVGQPLIDANTCLFQWSNTTFGFVAKIRLHGDKSPTPAGIAVNACHNFASVVSNSPYRSPHPSMQRCRQLLTFGLFQPQCFGDSIKVESEDCFQCSVLSFLFKQFLLQNRIVAVILVRGGNFVDAFHNCVCHVPKVFLGSWNDEVDKNHQHRPLACSLSCPCRLTPWGSAMASGAPIVYASNLWHGLMPSSVSIYFVATSHAVLVAAQKYGENSTRPICSNVGTTSHTGSPARLALVGIGGMLGVVHWWGNWKQCWGIGSGALALRHC
jgi:hypothetical protein